MVTFLTGFRRLWFNRRRSSSVTSQHGGSGGGNQLCHSGGSGILAAGRRALRAGLGLPARAAMPTTTPPACRACLPAGYYP